MTKKVRIVIEERGWPWSKWRKVSEYRQHIHDFVYDGYVDSFGCIRKCNCGLKEKLQGFQYQGDNFLYTQNETGRYPVWIKTK